MTTDSILNGSAFTDIGVSSDCAMGMFVYYNTVTGNYEPAYQQLDPNKTNFNDLTPAESMYVVGVIISPVIDGKATILTSGLIRNKSVLAAIFGAKTNVPGNYYLDVDGKLTSDVTSLRLPLYCGTLTDTGCFILNIQTPDFRTHNHSMYKLVDSNWTDNVYSDPSLTYILNSFYEGLCLVADGKVLEQDKDYSVNGDTIIYHGDTIPTDCILYFTTPFMGPTGWITGVSVAPGNNLLNVAQINNKAIIDTNLTTNVIDGNGYCVSTIDRSGVKTAPVVNSLEAGNGITITNNEGKCKVSLTSSSVVTLDLNILNSNGVVFGGGPGDADFTLLKFPANTYAAVKGVIRIPADVQDSALSIVLWVAGGSNDRNGSIQLKRLTLTEDPNIAAVEGVVSMTLPNVDSTTNSSNYAYKLTSSSSIAVKGGDLISVTVSFEGEGGTVSAYSIAAELV